MDLNNSANKVNHVLETLAFYNSNLIADGEVGQQVIIACGEFLKGDEALCGEVEEKDINEVITALKEAGFNDALKPDGDVGNECVKAIKYFLFFGLSP